MRVNQAGHDLVFGMEQYREFAYPDPASPLARATASLKLGWGFRPAREILAGLDPQLAALSAAPWTCGIGTTKGVTPDTRFGRAQAEAIAHDELEQFAKGVFAACTVAPNENQLAAMASFAYNVGLKGFKGSSVLKAHNRGDFLAASRAYGLWNRAGGIVMAGLERRRREEAALYLRPVPAYEAAPAPDFHAPAHQPEAEMPQTVDPESKMTSSTINRASVVAGATAAAATITEISRAVADVKTSFSSLGDWLLPALLVAVVCLCGYIVYERLRVRKEGFS